MKPLSAAVLAAAALFLFLISPFARADSIKVGDYAQPGNYSLLHEEGEILAPVLLGLSHAGFSFIARGQNLTLSTPAGKEVLLTMGQRKARVDGQELELQSPPRFLNQRCYLPVHSLAAPLGMMVIWEEEQKRLTLLPRLTVLKVKEREDRLVLHLGAEVPLAYSIGRLVEPPRIFVDISNVVLSEGMQRIDVNSGILLGVRAATGEIGNPGLRVVMDLSSPALAEIKTAKEGCLLQLHVPAKPASLSAPQAVLQEVSFQRNSERVASILLSLSAPAVVHSEMRKEENCLVVRVFGAASRLEEPPKIAEDELVTGLELHSLGPLGEVQEMRVHLKKEARHLLLAEGKEIQVLVGEFSLSGVKVVIDPGHGGIMSGAIGRSGLMEKEVNLDIALRLERLLKQAGAKVFLTRREDCELRPIPRGKQGPDRDAWRAELSMRPGLANAVGADLFLSIHCNANALSNPQPRTGTEVYYWTPNSRLLAQTLLTEMVRTLGRNNGGIFGDRPFVVIREARMPAVLIEVAYLDNAEEEELLASEDFRELAAKAIFAGLSRYVESAGPLGLQVPPEPAPPVPQPQ